MASWHIGPEKCCSLLPEQEGTCFPLITRIKENPRLWRRLSFEGHAKRLDWRHDTRHGSGMYVLQFTRFLDSFHKPQSISNASHRFTSEWSSRIPVLYVVAQNNDFVWSFQAIVWILSGTVVPLLPFVLLFLSFLFRCSLDVPFLSPVLSVIPHVLKMHFKIFSRS